MAKAGITFALTVALTVWALWRVVANDLLGWATLWLLPVPIVGLWVSWSYWRAAKVGAPGPGQDLERKGSHRINIAGLLALAMSLGTFSIAVKVVADRSAALKDADTAEAIVLKREYRRSPPRGGSYWAELRFSLPDGRSIATSVGGVSLSIPEGTSRVRIIYKRDNPHSVVVDEDPSAYVLATVLSAFGCGLLALAWVAARPLR